MRVRNVKGESEKVELLMTPMIDIVFLLLIFFIMTFKIIAPEGDFNIKMPLAAPSPGPPNDSQLPPMKVRLRADGSGELSSIVVGAKRFGRDFGALHLQIRDIVADAGGPAASPEVELDCDYELKFKNVINAITAVSGYVTDDGQSVVTMVEKIKFSPPRKPKKE